MGLASAHWQRQARPQSPLRNQARRPGPAFGPAWRNRLVLVATRYSSIIPKSKIRSLAAQGGSKVDVNLRRAGYGGFGKRGRADRRGIGGAGARKRPRGETGFGDLDLAVGGCNPGGVARIQEIDALAAGASPRLSVLQHDDVAATLDQKIKGRSAHAD